jgi:phosphatidylglycerophosphate synthase
VSVFVKLQDLRRQNYGRQEPLVYQALRRVSILLSYLCVRWGIAPNTVTVLSTLAAVIAAFLLAVGSSYTVRMSAVAIVVSFILDCMDGEIARAARRESIFGIQLEHITSWLIIGILQAGAAIGVMRSHQGVLFCVAAFSSLVGWYGFYFLFLQLRIWIPQEADFSLLRKFSRVVYRIMPFDQNLLILFAASNAIQAYLMINAILAPLLFLISFVLFIYYAHSELSRSRVVKDLTSQTDSCAKAEAENVPTA